MSFVFDLLGDEFTEDQLFGEVLRADYDSVGARRTAGREQAMKETVTEVRTRRLRTKCMGPSLRSR